MRTPGTRGVGLRAVRRFSAAGFADETEDAVAAEEPLEIRVHEEPVAVTMRTPGHDAELALGFLFSEGIVQSTDDVGSIFHCGRPGDEGFGNAIEVKAAGGVDFEVEKIRASRRGTLTTSACGVCGRQTVDDLLKLVGVVPEGPAVNGSVVAAAPETLRRVQENFARTGGVHAAAALDSTGALLVGFEDVGRHNAVDKVVGSLVKAGRIARRSRVLQRADAAILVVSGRASFEIVQKAALAGIGIVCSVSAASTLAIDLAARANIALCSFTRGGEMNVFGAGDRFAMAR